MSSADKISDERLAEIAAEYGSMADGLPPQLEDAPGAASAFYMSCSLGEVAAMARELATRRAQSAVVGDGDKKAMQAAICTALLDAYPMADKIADNYAAVAVRAINATREGK